MIDIMSLMGVIGGLFVIAVGIYIGGQNQISALGLYWDPASVFITLGGAFCSMMINFTFKDIKSLFSVIRAAFINRGIPPEEIIRTMRKFTDIARRNGVLALEPHIAEIEDPFFQRAMMLASEGLPANAIESTLKLELDYMLARHERGQKMLKQLATYAPAFGMIGTLIGLVLMLSNLNDPKALGPGMAVAIITTFYGAMVSYWICTPLAEKLALRSKDEALTREMIIVGVVSIAGGDTPRQVEQKLKVFIAPRQREML